MGIMYVQLTCIWALEPGIFKEESLGNKMSLPAENKKR